MNKLWLYGFLLSLVLGGLAYLSTDSWMFGGGAALVYLFAFVFFLRPSIASCQEGLRKRHEGYKFINTYLITLSVCQSLEKAYENAVSGMGPEFRLLNGSMENMNAREKVEYLSSYFDSGIYSMFLSLLSLHLDRGGDILDLSSDLLHESSRIEESAQSYWKKAKGKILGFYFLWAMAFVILVFLRFGLTSFFTRIKGSWAYLGCVGLFHLLFLGSSILLLRWHAPRKRKPLKEEKAHV